MDMTLSFSEVAITGLQRLATDGGHEDVAAFCYAVCIEKAGEGVRKNAVASDAERLAKLNAAPKALRDQIDAIEVTDPVVIIKG
jgi:hypothetical protein